MQIADDEFIERVIKKMLTTNSFKTRIKQTRDYYKSVNCNNSNNETEPINNDEEKITEESEINHDHDENNKNYKINIKRKRG